MTADKLATALGAVNWDHNVTNYFKDGTSAKALAKSNLRLAVWAKQFEITDTGNPALCFIREMQVASQHVAVLTALSLYKPAAASMRTMLETALYYSYFRTHPSELTTLASDPNFYIGKRDLLEYHIIHTSDFKEIQNKLDLVSSLGDWYRTVSAIIHGQIPGTWVEHKSVAEIKHIQSTQDIVVETFTKGEEIVHRLFLCTVGRELWDGFSSTAKKRLLSGIHGELKAALALDSA